MRQFPLRVCHIDNKISIHASLTGCDAERILTILPWFTFQPTHPSRDATTTKCMVVDWQRDFNPRIPHGMRLHLGGRRQKEWHFNPRIPHGMRRSASVALGITISFQSTHPSRDATSCWPPPFGTVLYFNPRIPHGMRLKTLGYYTGTSAFQSTHPSRDATPAGIVQWFLCAISIHASLTGCD